MHHVFRVTLGPVPGDAAAVGACQVIVLGELSQLAGWVAYDGNEHGLAQRYPT